MEMAGLQSTQHPFLLSPCLHLQLILLVFCTVKNSVSEYLKNTAIARNSTALNKSKSSVRRERVNWSQGVGWEYQDPACKLCLRSARNSSGVGEAVLGVVGNLQLAVLFMECSRLWILSRQSYRLLRLYASVCSTKAKAVNSISQHFNFILIQEIHLSLKKPVAFTLTATKAIPCG